MTYAELLAMNNRDLDRYCSAVKWNTARFKTAREFITYMSQIKLAANFPNSLEAKRQEMIANG